VFLTFEFNNILWNFGHILDLFYYKTLVFIFTIN